MAYDNHEVSVEQEIGTVIVSRPHLVILGAGASLATCPMGDAYGRPLPLMSTLVAELGLKDLLPQRWRDNTEDFEQLYDALTDAGEQDVCRQLQQRVCEQFEKLELPPQPTIYDHLVLSLRGTDVIASFNWDPLLLQAHCRNRSHAMSVPKLAFLHGNVSMAYCPDDKIISVPGTVCRVCGKVMTPSPLLFPVRHKDYASDAAIADQWKLFSAALKNAFMLTIFGYRGPRTDAEALKRMRSAWGRPNTRAYEQTAFITRPGATSNDLSTHWGAFVFSHHHERCDDFYMSWIAKHPRRTGEAWWNQYFEAKFIRDNPIPRGLAFSELWKWYGQFSAAEEKHAAEG